jgi:hypothetical protein
VSGMSALSRPNLAVRRARAGLPPLDDVAGPGEGEGADVAALLQRRPPDPPRDG